MVRTDCRAQKLDAFLQPKEKAAVPVTESSGTNSGEAGTSRQPCNTDVDEMEDAEMLEAATEQEVGDPQDGVGTSISNPDLPR